MAANTAPIFPLVPDVSWAAECTVGNTTKDLTSGTSYLVATAGVDGMRVEKLRVRPKGTNVASVLRVFINNGSVTTTAANNTLFDELGLPATTNSEVASSIGYEIPMNMSLPNGYRIYVTLGTTVAGGYAVTALNGKYS